MIACLAVLVLLPVAPLPAKQLKPTDYALRVTADRAEPVYHKNETVTFTISLTLKGEPVKGAKVKWKISKDGLEPALQEGTAVMDEKGSVIVSGALNEPGFLQCRADFTSPGESVPTGRASAAIDPKEIQASLPVPDDFDAFWKEEKRKLAAVPVNVRLTPVKSRRRSGILAARSIRRSA